MPPARRLAPAYRATRLHGKRSPGRIRRSQAISTFGIGSIVDFRWESVMTVGLDLWPEDPDAYEEVHEPALEAALGVEYFRAPVGAENTFAVPATRFPSYLECTKCHRIGRVNEVFTVRGSTGPQCADCGSHAAPVRLIVACYPKDASSSAADILRAHVDDFPWIWWVHSQPDSGGSDRAKSKGACERPALVLESQGKSSGLGDIRVRCKNDTCRANRSLANAFRPGALSGLVCSRRRPWLQDVDPAPCKNELRVLQRGASNVYFPVVASALSIPPWVGRAYEALDRNWNVFSRYVLPEDTDALKTLLRRMALPSLTGLTDDQLIEAIRQRQDASTRRGHLTEEEARRSEYETIKLGFPPATGAPAKKGQYFECEVIDPPEGTKGYLSMVSLLHRLREVRALRGFTRIDPPAPGDRYGIDVASIAATRGIKWLPGYEVRGEGVFLEIDASAVDRWARKEVVLERSSTLDGRYRDLCRKRGWTKNRVISPRLLAVHTLAHLLIRQLSLEAGYSTASLRERLYVSEGPKPMSGLLIYTASADSDGSLGGLVRQGDPARLKPILDDALENARTCSSDPLCAEGRGQESDALSLASCHACALLPETSCEESNRFLDRAALVGIHGEGELGLFEGGT